MKSIRSSLLGGSSLSNTSLNLKNDFYQMISLRINTTSKKHAKVSPPRFLVRKTKMKSRCRQISTHSPGRKQTSGNIPGDPRFFISGIEINEKADSGFNIGPVKFSDFSLPTFSNVDNIFKKKDIFGEMFEFLDKNSEEEVLGSTPSDVVWKIVSIPATKAEGHIIPEPVQVKTTYVPSNRSQDIIQLLNDDFQKIRGDENPENDKPENNPVSNTPSILNILNSVDRSAVVIQKDLYITSRILDTIKKKEDDKETENKEIEASSNFEIKESDKNFQVFDLDKEEKLIFIDEKTTNSEIDKMANKDFLKSYAWENFTFKDPKVAKSGSRTLHDASKKDNVDIASKTVITSTSKENGSEISVVEVQKFTDKRLPFPFSTETVLQVFGTKEKLNEALNVIEQSKAKLAVLNSSDTSKKGMNTFQNMLTTLKSPKETTIPIIIPVNTFNVKKTPKHVELAKLAKTINSEKAMKITFKDPKIRKSRVKSLKEDKKPERNDKVKIIGPSQIDRILGLKDEVANKKSAYFKQEKPKEEQKKEKEEKVIEIKPLIATVEQKFKEDEESLSSRDRTILKDILDGKYKVKKIKSPKSEKKETKITKQLIEKIKKDCETPLFGNREPCDPGLKPKDIEKPARELKLPKIKNELKMASKDPKITVIERYNKKKDTKEINKDPKVTVIEHYSIQKPIIQAMPEKEAKSESVNFDKLPEENENVKISIVIPKDSHVHKRTIDEKKVEEKPFLGLKSREFDEDKQEYEELKVELKPDIKNNVLETRNEMEILEKPKSVKLKDVKPVINVEQESRQEIKHEKPKNEIPRGSDVIPPLTFETKSAVKDVKPISETKNDKPPMLNFSHELVRREEEKKIKPILQVSEKMEPELIKKGVEKPFTIDDFKKQVNMIKIASEKPYEKVVSANNQVSQFLFNFDKFSKETTPILDRSLCPECPVPEHKILDFPMLNPVKVPTYSTSGRIISIDVSNNIMLKKSLKGIPSVTTILNTTMADTSRAALSRWRTSMINQLGEAGFRKFYKEQLKKGSDFHGTVHQYLKKVTSDGKSDDSSNLTFQSIKDVLANVTDVSVLESQVIHSQLGYRGVIDCVAKYKNVPVVIEWKRSDKPKPTVRHTFDAPLQLSAYIGALNYDPAYDFQVQGAVVVVAYSDGTKADVFTVSLEECAEYWAQWLDRYKTYIKENQGFPLSPLS